MGETDTIVPATSPVIKKEVIVGEAKPATFDFPVAVRQVIEGKKITRVEWGNEKIYGFLNRDNGHVMLHKEDGNHDWIMTEGDLVGEDWRTIG